MFTSHTVSEYSFSYCIIFLGYYFLVLLPFSLFQHLGNIIPISINQDMVCDYIFWSEYSLPGVNQVNIIIIQHGIMGYTKDVKILLQAVYILQTVITWQEPAMMQCALEGRETELCWCWDKGIHRVGLWLSGKALTYQACQVHLWGLFLMPRWEWAGLKECLLVRRIIEWLRCWCQGRWEEKPGYQECGHISVGSHWAGANSHSVQERGHKGESWAWRQAIHGCMCVRTHTQAQTHIYTHICTHAHTCTHMHIYALMHTHKHTYTHIYVLMHTYMYTFMHTHVYTFMHSCTHM